MKPVLNKSCPVHRPDEDRDEHHPVMERRAVGVRGEGEYREAAREQLNELLHPLNLGPKEA